KKRRPTGKRTLARIETRGLESSGEALALATPAQLRHLADIDLWRAPQPGRDEQFDANRFLAWIEVLVDVSPSVAARQLAELDLDVLVTGVSSAIFAYEHGAIGGFETTDGYRVRARQFGNRRTGDIGRYIIVERSGEGWDAIVDMLMALEADRPERFRDVMD